MKVKDLLIETSTYTKFRQYIFGVKLAPNGIAILTSENPEGKETTKEENKKRTKSLETYLKENKFVYDKQVGKYGVFEHSFIIYDISLQESKKIGQKYKQETIIHIIQGDPKTGEKPIYTMASTDSSSRIDDDLIVRSIYKLADITDDYYSNIKNNKYNIPFFDEDERKYAEEHTVIKHKNLKIKNGYKSLFVS